jgi:hypothetical protein
VVQWQASARAYQQHMYNIMGDNCHAFCAHFLNQVAYRGSCNWNMIHLVSSPRPLMRLRQHAQLHFGSCCAGHVRAATHAKELLRACMQAAMVFLRGRYVSAWGAAKQWLPFCVIMPVGLCFGTWYFAVAWAGGLVLPLLAWFLLYNYVLNRQPLGSVA